MNIKTNISDDNCYEITIVDGNKHFSFEINIIKTLDGGMYVDFTNSNRDTYNLLKIESSGAITSETPTLE